MSVNVLSLFNGMSCGMLALERSGFNVLTYYSAEIDKYANQVTADNYRGIVQLGDVTKWREWDIEWDSIDIILGGFPCQAWSMAGKQLGDKDERGMLFWTMLDIMKHVRSLNPDADFLIENVKMKKEFEEYITHHTTEALGDVHKILINSALVSAQNRNRYYWTSFPVTQPGDKGIVLADILETGGVGSIKNHGEWKERNNKSMCVDANYHKGVDNHGQRTMVKCGRVVGRKINPTTGKRDDYNVNLKTEQRVEPRLDDKSGCLTTVQKDNVVLGCRTYNRKDGLTKELDKAHTLSASDWRGLNRNQNQTAVTDGVHYRKLTPIECERLQTVPDNFTASVSNTQRYKMLGNGWTVDVISHILSHIRGKYE